MIGRRQTLAAVAAVVLILVVVALAYYALGAAGQRHTPPVPPSAAADWYELYFTTPGTRGIDQRLVALIDGAQRTVDAASYDFDLESVASALAAAKKRGVRVRFVTDTDTVEHKNAEIQRAWTILRQAEIPIVDDRRGPIMHHKFAVVDGEWVWTGSSNWTVGDTERLNNNAVKIRSRELAQNYTAEFEKMFVARKFGPAKARGVPHPRLGFGAATLETYFAPQDDAGAKVVQRVEAARESIQFLAFSFTHDRIGRAMVDRHRAGVKVRGVFETTGSQTRFSEYGPMKEAGLEVYLDGNPYVMHHKVIVLDARVTIFGSFNFSSNADEENDENMLIVEDPTLAAGFLGEIERVVQVARNPPPRKS